MTEAEYKIVPRIKKRWFISDVKVYDVLKCYVDKYWSDSSYGNGGGKFIYYDREDLLGTFETFMEADQFKNELL